jgi:hypothetical protein
LNRRTQDRHLAGSALHFIANAIQLTDSRRIRLPANGKRRQSSVLERLAMFEHDVQGRAKLLWHDSFSVPVTKKQRLERLAGELGAFATN